jgi:AcrR family transcriptional regulator
MAVELRSDARRNRDLVLRAAEEVFATEGTHVPLTVVARHAGVGAGTVHRHFPTKEALLGAVVLARIDQLAEGTRAAVDQPERFFDAFTHLVREVGVNKALCAAMAGDIDVPAAGDEFRAALGALVGAAQRAGVVRADVTVEDVSALIAGCVAMERQHSGAGRMTALAAELLGVTKVGARNETGDGTRCPVCGTELAAPATGRRPKFCGAACRQRAHRQRRTHLGDGP